MSTHEPNNFAFIDSQNLNLGVNKDIVDKVTGKTVYTGWKLDTHKFRVYLNDKYNVTSAYLFIGYMPENQLMYKNLQKDGFLLIFKETQRKSDGSPKGNVDAELVLNAMIEYPNYDQAVIVSGDGDFACLVDYLRRTEKLRMLLVPNEIQYSGLLKKAAGNSLDSVSKLKKKLEYTYKKKSTPVGRA